MTEYIHKTYGTAFALILCECEGHGCLELEMSLSYA
jgi:hypothetical protein